MTKGTFSYVIISWVSFKLMNIPVTQILKDQRINRYDVMYIFKQR